MLTVPSNFEPHDLWSSSSSEESDSDGALAQNVWLCCMQLSVLLPGVTRSRGALRREWCLCHEPRSV